MKNRVRISALMLAAFTLLLVLCSCGSKTNLPDPTDAYYVYDEAGVIDSRLANYIVGKNIDLSDKCGGEIVVACVNTTGAMDIKDYAHALFNKWEIGSAEKSNGFLILLSIEEDDYWVLQGSGLEDLLQSGTIKLMLDDYLEPYFAKKQYADGVRALFDAVINEYEQIYSINVIQLSQNAVSFTPSEISTIGNKLTFGSFVATVASIIVAVTIIIIVIAILITIVITVFIIISSVFSAGRGIQPPRGTFRGGMNINPHSFRPSGTYHRSGSFNFGGSNHSGGFNFGGFSSGRSGGGFSGGRSGGGFSGGSHRGGGGGFSRGGGAGRR